MTSTIIMFEDCSRDEIRKQARRVLAGESVIKLQVDAEASRHCFVLPWTDKKHGDNKFHQKRGEHLLNSFIRLKVKQESGFAARVARLVDD